MSSDAPAPKTPTQTAPEKQEVGQSGDRPDEISAGVLRPGRRTTCMVDHAIIEAELVAEGTDLDNPAIPADQIMDEVLRTLNDRDLDPAWQVSGGRDE